jgi:hypothetical protein
MATHTRTSARAAAHARRVLLNTLEVEDPCLIEIATQSAAHFAPPLPHTHTPLDFVAASRPIALDLAHNRAIGCPAPLAADWRQQAGSCAHI